MMPNSALYSFLLFSAADVLADRFASKTKVSTLMFSYFQLMPDCCFLFSLSLQLTANLAALRLHANEFVVRMEGHGHDRVAEVTPRSQVVIYKISHLKPRVCFLFTRRALFLLHRFVFFCIGR